MQVCIVNESEQPIIVAINRENYAVASNEKISVCSDENYLNIILNHTYESTVIKHWYAKEYQLVVNTEYFLEGTKENGEILITDKKIQLERNIFYNYFSINMKDLNLVFENHNVSQKDDLIKKYKNKVISDAIFLVGIDSVGLFLSLSWVLYKKSSYKIGAVLISFCCSLVALVLLTIVYFLQAFKHDKKSITKFKSYFENSFILQNTK